MRDRRTEAQAERLKAALRENLKRRKAQARGREGAPREEEEPPPAPKRDPALE